MFTGHSARFMSHSDLGTRGLLPWFLQGDKKKMKEDETLLRSQHVAHLLDVSPDEAIELARKRKLKAKKVGRFWRYRLKDVMEYKNRCQETESR